MADSLNSTSKSNIHIDEAESSGFLQVAPPEGATSKGYALAVNGTCMNPVVTDGSFVFIEPRLPDYDELAVVLFKSDGLRSLKQSKNEQLHTYFPVNPASNIVALLSFRQLQPERHRTCMADQVASIHVATHVMVDDQWLNVSTLLANHKTA